MEYSLQLYSIRDLTRVNLEEALRRVSEIGYRQVEFAGFFGHSADDIAAMLARYQLKASGTHTEWTDILQNPEEVAAYHKTIGTNQIIIPGTDVWTRETMNAFVDGVNQIQPVLKEAGMTLSFHNHYKEFRTMPNGFVPYEEILHRTSLNLEIDTYWAFFAKHDPVQLMEKYCDRLQFIHIKDGTCDGHGRPLGMGMAPVEAVYRKAAELNIPMVVESETLTPDGITEARICFEKLKELENGH
jgi:Sugar phosphate isomerases/epimerases